LWGRRLKQAAEAGDKEAQAELARMERTKMKELKGEEIFKYRTPPLQT
jgi:hypothetical protein